MGGWILDLRCTVRGLLRRPLFGIGIVATLALGIGVNVAIFSVADAVVFAPLPYESPERLVRVHPNALFYANRDGVAWFQERNTTFSDMAGWGRAIFTFERDGQADEVRGGRVQWNHFRLLGVEPFLGRTFRPDDATGDGSNVVVLSYDLWAGRFGADSTLVGSTVSVSGTPFSVIGVLPPDHQPIEEDWEAWGPINMDPGHRHAGNAMAFNARLRPGATLEQAQAEMRALFQERATDFDGAPLAPDELADITVVPLQEFLMAGADRLVLPALLAVALVLLVACGNLSSLVLAHARARAREMAIRRAIGAGGGRIGRLVLTEAGLLATAGGAAGLLVAVLVLEAFATALPDVLPRTRGLSVDGRVLAFAFGATAFAALVSWAAPLLRSARAPEVPAGGARGGRGRSDAGSLMVAGQIALTVVLVGAASLTLRSWAALTAEDPGFRPESVVTFRPRFPSGRFDQVEQARVHQELLAALERTPGVQAAGTILFMPMHSGGAYTTVRDPAGPAGPEARVNLSFRMVSPGYFDAMGIPVLSGRTFTEEDHEDAEPVVVLNRTAANDIWPGEEAVGRLLATGSGETERRVVGVVADVRQSGLATEAMPEMYYPVLQVPSSRRAYAVRVSGAPEDAMRGIVDAVRGVEPALALMDFGPLEDVVGRSVSRPRFFTALLSLFGLTALALGLVGVWSVTSHAVRRARRELGIRIALGAPGGELVRQLALRGLGPIALGTVVGLIGFVLLGRLFEGALYRVEPTDPLTLVLVPVVLLAVGTLATVGPALRARAVDPVEILRDE